MTSPLSRRAVRLGLAGIVAFTIYGSFVPFHYKARPWAEVPSAFRWSMLSRAAPESRSDGLANVMLGVPLGFCLLGTLRGGRENGLATAAVGGLLLPLCAAFAAAVEFGQLYFPGRTCSGSDVIAQTLGSMIGILGWVFAGPWLCRQLDRALDGSDAAAAGLRFTAMYAGFVLLVEWLPLDFSASPVDLYRRIARSEEGVTWIPFGELLEPGARGRAGLWDRIQHWLELALVFLPVGLLLSRTRLGRTHLRAVALAFAFAGFAEAGQLTVSRHASTTDVLIGADAIILGWWIPRIVATRRDAGAFLSQLWLIALVLIHWHPFAFQAGRWPIRWSQLEWWPLAAQVNENYLWALDKVLTKFVLFVPCGILAAWSGHWHKGWVNAAGLGLVAATAMELGQAFLPERHASPTDVLIGVVGAMLGAVVGRRAALATESAGGNHA